MGSGLRDGFGPPAALGSPFLRHLGGGLCRGPGSLRVPHYLTQDHRDLGGIQDSGNQRVHQSALISNFGTSKSRTCARLGCLRIERWAREGIARANVAFPPIATSTVAIANGSFTSVRDVAQSYQMRGFRPFGDRDAMARMRKYRSFPNGAANGSIRPFPRVPFGPATEGMRQKAAQGATGAVRQERTFPALSPSR